MSVTDFHNHVMPGVDDGARDGEQAKAAVAAFAAAGAECIIATPHFNGSLTLDLAAQEARLAQLDAGWADLGRVAGALGVTLYRGAEVALDVPRPQLHDPRVRLAGGPFVLVEFAFMTVPPNSPGVLASIRADGYEPILAHPERYGRVDDELELARAWRDAGAYLQVNGGSLFGRYGAEPRRAAMRLLEHGLADYLSSDFHARGDPGIPAYRRILEEAGGEEHAYLLLELNPGRILKGQAPLPVPPLRLRRDGLWQRMRGLLRP